jgi:hypothetical protein
MLFHRQEGTPVRDIPSVRRMMPFIMRTRNESNVYFEQRLVVDGTLAYIEKHNAAYPDEPINLFQIILCAAVRAIGMRPHMNRFVVGGQIYQRNNLEMSFAVKKKLDDASKMTAVKVTFDKDDTLRDVARRVREGIGEGRGTKNTESETEMDWVLKLPATALRLVMWGQRVLDAWNLLPHAMIKNDPLYCTVFFANLGSVGIDSGYHHLYEYGTAPLFGVIGRIKKAQVVTEDGEVLIRDVVDNKFTFDERITDGLYCAKSLDMFKAFIENPVALENPPEGGEVLGA